jgi:hypothetical protein
LTHLKIMQWNAQSLLCSRHFLTKFIYDNNIDLAVISETWLRPEQKFKIRGYNIERSDCGNKHNGVAIIIHNRLQYSKLNTKFDDSLQNLAVQVKIKNKLLTVVSVYCPPHSSPTFNIKKFTELVNNLPKPIYIAGDFNAHHTIWGCHTIDARGRNLLDALDECYLVLLNDTQPTTVGTHSWRPNGLDLTMVSSNIALDCNWSVNDDPLGSYHLPTITSIQFSVNINFSYSTTDVHNMSSRPKFNLVNWDHYSKLVNQMLSGFLALPDDPLHSYKVFCDILLEAVNKSILYKRKSNKHNVNFDVNVQSLRSVSSQQLRQKPFRHLAVPWWNERCSIAVRDSKDAFISFKNDPSLDNYVKFKKLQGLKKLIIKKERSNSWKEFCSNINRSTPMSNIWNTMRKFNKSFVSRPDQYETPWLNDFLKKYTPDFVSPPPFSIQNSSVCNNNNNNIYLAMPFNITELNSAIKSRKDTSCGLDFISYKMFKKLNNNNLDKFLLIINDLWNNNIIPSQWKEDCLVPVLKPNKNKDCSDSYRPIALTSCVGKIFEQLLKQRLEFYIESNSLLPNNQFGFRRGRSARESVGYLYEDIQKTVNKNNSLACVFFDIVGAFNNVNITILVSVLHSLGISLKLVEWIFNFLNGRKVYVKIDNKLHGPRLSYRGVCQGGILSPLLYILYIHRLNEILGSDITINNLQFADDLVVYSSGSSLVEIEQKLNNALYKLRNYFDYLNLDVNPTKSKVIVFKKFGTNLSNIQLLYANHQIPQESSAKFLGVTFQQNLKWKEYVDCLIDRSIRATNILKSLVGTQWGADPKILLLLYKSIVRSHFEYAYFCFGLDQKLLDKLDKIQNKNLRIILGAMNTSPINSMQIECNLPPLYIRFLFLNYNFLLKLTSLNCTGQTFFIHLCSPFYTLCLWLYYTSVLTSLLFTNLSASFFLFLCFYIVSVYYYNFLL